MNTNTGGPAFFGQANEAAKRQSASVGVPYQAPSGMTLRDYFAAKAMQGLMGRAWQDPATGNAPDNVFDLWAKAAYATADAMLAAREVKA
jgi:hypothetical protein